MKKNCIKNSLLRNSLLTCAATLALGTGLMINYQTVQADATPTSSQPTQQSTTSAPVTEQPAPKTNDNGNAGPTNTPEMKGSDASVRPAQPVTAPKAATITANSSPKITPAVEKSNLTAVSDSGVTASPQVVTTTPTGKVDDNSINQTKIDKNNFTNYFDTHGCATYDQSKGIVTLTPDKNNMIGNFTLNQKIDLSQDFSLVGKVNLGNKPENRGGADGMGFAFHTGNTDAVGNAGGNMGIGGLPNALGFKLDTFHNDAAKPASSKDNAEIDPNNSNDFGWSADPYTQNGSNAFGAFVTTSDQSVTAQNNQKARRWWATTLPTTKQDLNTNDLNGQFHDFSIKYTAAGRKITINYTPTTGKDLVWTNTVPQQDGQAVSLSVTSSTGGNKNQHQFLIESMNFTPAATINVRHIDYLTGKDIAQNDVTYPDGALKGKTYQTTNVTIPNYIYMGLNGQTIPITVKGQTINVPINVKNIPASAPASGELANEGSNGTVIYVYAPNPEGTFDNADVSDKSVKETIHYVEEGTNNTLHPDYNSPSVVYVTGSKGQSTITLYHNNNDGLSLTDKQAWHGTTDKENQNFNAVTNPSIAGYHIVNIQAPNQTNPDDLSAVEMKTNDGTKDQEYTVYYVKDENTSEGGNEGGNTENPGKPGIPTEPEGPDTNTNGPKDPNDTKEPETPTDPKEPDTNPNGPKDPNDTKEPETSTDSENPGKNGESETDIDDNQGSTNLNNNNLLNTQTSNGDDNVITNVNNNNQNHSSVNSNPTTPIAKQLATAAQDVLGTSNRLPQTGNEQTSWLAYLGALLMFFVPAILKKH